MRVGAREIVNSGTVVTQYGDDTIEIEIADLRFKFVFSGREGDPKVEAEGAGNLLTLHFTNFNNSLGIAWSSEVGTLAGKKLFLAIYMLTLGEGDNLKRAVNFTFSAG